MCQSGAAASTVPLWLSRRLCLFIKQSLYFFLGFLKIAACVEDFEDFSGLIFFCFFNQQLSYIAHFVFHVFLLSGTCRRTRRERLVLPDCNLIILYVWQKVKYFLENVKLFLKHCYCTGTAFCDTIFID